MQAVFPGKPQSKLHALSTVLWSGRRLTAYITRNALIVLGGPRDLLQTVDHGEDEELQAVAIDQASGKIATCSRSTIYIYYPIDDDSEAPRWSLQQSLKPSNDDDALSTLSWGLPDEVLVGGASLTLFSTATPVKELWSKSLANPAKHAVFSHDASFIASTGQHDRLVKVWRRLFFGGENERFDVSYLAHPATVTQIQWRGRPNTDHPEHSILYTVCVDRKVRVWAATDPHGLQALQLWAELDLEGCMVPRAPPKPLEKTNQYVMFLDSWEFKSIMESLTEQDATMSFERRIPSAMRETSPKTAEVCLVLDNLGNMSAWGLARVGCKARQEGDVFKMFEVGVPNLRCLAFAEPEQAFQQLHCFDAPDHKATLSVLAHHFTGTVQWHSFAIDKLSEPPISAHEQAIEAVWTGHALPVDRLCASTQLGTFLSVAEREVIQWQTMFENGKSRLVRHSTIVSHDTIHQACSLAGKDCVFLVDDEQFVAWNTSFQNAELLGGVSHGVDDPSNKVLVPMGTGGSVGELFCLLDSSPNGHAWSIDTSTTDSVIPNIQCLDPLEFSEIQPQSLLTTINSSHMLTPPSGPVTLLMTSDKSGLLTLWKTISYKPGDVVRVIPQATVPTFVSNPSMIAGSHHKKAAIVDSDKIVLAIWNIADAQLESEFRFGAHEAIQEVKWFDLATDSATLAVVLRQRVVFYGQMRYDYLDNQQCWRASHQIDIAPLTNLPIVGTVYLGDNSFAVATGQPMFLFDIKQSATIQDHEKSHILDSGVAAASVSFSIELDNAALPVYHPQTIAQHLLSDQLMIVYDILLRLNDELRYFSDGDTLASSLGMEPHWQDHQADGVNRRAALGIMSDDSKPLSEEVALQLTERLSNVSLPHLSEREQAILVKLVDSIGATARHINSVDQPGLRYLIFMHYYHSQDLSQDLASSIEPPWREIMWASLSTSQDILIDLTSRRYQNRMLWQDARSCGMFMWLEDVAAVRAQFEIVARNEYTKTEEKNPVDCTLYYLALKKKSVLSGLWRMATWNKEQAMTIRLLANNFEDPRWKTAALKNAYALLGRRRFEYAASFFLLAGHLKDAANVLENQLNDVQLAIAVTRVYEGDGGPVLRELLTEKVLPRAVGEGNRWLTAWAFRMTGQRDLALRALTSPLEGLIPSVTTLNSAAMHFTRREPSLATLYRRLREEAKTTVQPSPKAEHEMLMYSVRTYMRMGCDQLALDLVRNWKFAKHAAATRVENGHVDTEADEAAREGADEQQAEEEPVAPTLMVDGKPRVKVVEEPSASSIFDNFDF